MTLEQIAASWGAGLSTILAALAIWDRYKSRSRISVGAGFGHPDYGGNEIHVQNISQAPLMLEYWELELRRKKLSGYEVMGGRYPDGGYAHVTIAPYGRHTLVFEEEEWFEWGAQHPERCRWILKLHIVGRRKPMEFKIYPR